MSRAMALMLCVLGAGSMACGDGSADPGRDTRMMVAGAQFVAGAMPAPSGGPAITGVVNPTASIRPGEVDRPLAGTLAPDATALLVQLTGDRGHWVVVAGAPTVALPDQPTFDLRLAFSAEQITDRIELVLSAVDADGRVGPAERLDLEVVETPVPEGELVVTLRWDRDADLDLRVVDPTGVEIFARNPNSVAPSRPGVTPSEAELAAGGRLDLDSNSQCVIDGRRVENVIWAGPPPAGRYTVRVDTFSLCAETRARWRVEVRRRGELIAEAEGVSTAADTRFEHDLGAGVLALTFDEAPQ